MEGKLSLQGFFLLVCLLIFSVSTVFAQPCTDHADCDDGDYCNGVETCDIGGTDQCIPGPLCDPPESCSEVDSIIWDYLVCIIDPPITYQLDFNDDEEWDTEWCLEIGETVDVAIWIDDYNLPEALWGSSWFFMNYDNTYLQLNVGNSYIYDFAHGGPWATGFSGFIDMGDGIAFQLYTGSPYGNIPVPGESKVKLAVIQLERIAPGDAQIGTEDGIVINYAARGFIPTDADATIYYCDDDNVCTADSCNSGTGDCIHDPTPHNGDSCDDGDLCTVNDVCGDGTCGGTAKDCSSLDDQCNLGVCDPGTGDCIQDPTPYNGDPCDDEDLCTVNDICSNGACGGTAKNCSSLNDQCNVGICDAGTGNCIQDSTPLNGNSCDDGKVITLNDTCSDGVCTGDTGAASIPTTSEWGMIIFMTIIMGLGVVTLFRRRLG